MEIGKFLHCILGKAVSVEEESGTEWEGSSKQVTFDAQTEPTFQQSFDQATVHVSAKVAVTFELKSLKNQTGKS